MTAPASPVGHAPPRVPAPRTPTPHPTDPHAVMRAVLPLDGFVSVSIVDPLTGTVLDSRAVRGTTGVVDTAAGATEALHALTLTTGRLATGSEVEDVVVTTSTHLHLFRSVTPEPGESALVVLTLDRDRSRLAVALRTLRDAGGRP